MDRSGVFETIVGVFVIIVAAVFMAYAYDVSGKSIGRDSYRVDAVFGRIDGITIGSDVRIAGVKVGSVAANGLDMTTYEADVQLSIEDGVMIPDDSVAKIVSDGLLGGAHVAIEPGASEEMLKNGDKITITQGSVDLLGLAVQSFTNQASQAPASENDGRTELDPLGDF